MLDGQPGDPARSKPDLDRVIPDQFARPAYGFLVAFTVQVHALYDVAGPGQYVHPVDHSVVGRLQGSDTQDEVAGESAVTLGVFLRQWVADQVGNAVANAAQLSYCLDLIRS